MGRIIAIANQKGGVGKTTTAINLSSCLADKGQKVLSIDMDPQGNMTSGLGVDKDEVEKTVYDLIIGEADIDEVIQRNVMDNLDIIPLSSIILINPLHINALPITVILNSKVSLGTSNIILANSSPLPVIIPYIKECNYYKLKDILGGKLELIFNDINE